METYDWYVRINFFYLQCELNFPFFFCVNRNILENRRIDNELIKTLQWIINVWQCYNECLQKLSLQDALLGPALFFDCPMEREAIFEYVEQYLLIKMIRKKCIVFINSWLQTKWNTIVTSLARELSMNKCAQPKSKGSTSATAAATAIASSLQANSLEISTPYESVACTTLYDLFFLLVLSYAFDGWALCFFCFFLFYCHNNVRCNWFFFMNRFFLFFHLYNNIVLVHIFFCFHIILTLFFCSHRHGFCSFMFFFCLRMTGCDKYFLV